MKSSLDFDGQLVATVTCDLKSKHNLMIQY